MRVIDELISPPLADDAVDDHVRNVHAGRLELPGQRLAQTPKRELAAACTRIRSKNR